MISPKYRRKWRSVMIVESGLKRSEFLAIEKQIEQTARGQWVYFLLTATDLVIQIKKVLEDGLSKLVDNEK